MARLGGGRRRAAAAQGKTPGPHEFHRRPDVVARRRKTGAPEEHGVLAPTAALPVHAEAPLFAAYKPGAVAAVALGHKARPRSQRSVGEADGVELALQRQPSSTVSFTETFSVA